MHLAASSGEQMTTFTSIQLARWRQFDSISIDLSESVCVLTGPNGCGKTTILSVLGKHFGWNLNFLSSPLFTKDQRRFYSDALDTREAESAGTLAPNDNPKVGILGYSDGSECALTAPLTPNPHYQLVYQAMQQVVGLHIPSHRPPPSYHQLQNIPISPRTNQEHFQQYQSFLFQTYGEHSSRNPAGVMKETLISLAVFGEGNQSVRGNPEYVRILAGFNDILTRLLPPGVGFERILVSTPDVLLQTKSGTFPLESMSGGLNALFSIAWQIYTHGHDKKDCTVLIDEPENHLHPSMQREFLPKLAEAFPSYKFVIATHSPFVVTSMQNSAVYALTYNHARKIISERLSSADLAGSPNKVLRDILDVPAIMPIWAAAKIDQVLSRYSTAAFDRTTITKIRDELRAEGLSDALGDYLVQQEPRS